MLIAARNAMMAGKRLPYDAEVEYLRFQSLGFKNVTTYIDTGVKPNQTLEFEIDCLWDIGANTNYGQELISWRAKNPVDRFSFDCRYMLSSYSAHGYSYCNDGPHWYYGVNQPSNIRLHYAYHNNILTTDFNGQHTFPALQSFTSNCPVWLGAANDATEGVCNPFGGNIYSCKLWLNGILVRDFIPVRVGSVGYMYDRVSGQLFGNQGTGDFVLGPDKN